MLNSRILGTLPSRQSPPGRAGLVRDKKTWIRYGQLGVFAFLIDGYAPTVSLLADDLGLSLSQAAMHGPAVGLGVLLAGAVSARLTAIWGREALTWMGLFGMCAGVFSYCFSGQLAFTLAGIGVAGFSGALLMAAGNADLAARHGSRGPQALNEGAAVSQGVGLVAPLFLGLGAAGALGWRAGLMVLVVLSVALASVGLARGTRRRAPSFPQGKIRSLAPQRMSPRFWAMWLCFVCLLGIEFSMTMWTPMFLSERTGLSAPLATAAITVTLSGMMIGRFVFARLVASRGLDALLLAAIALSLLGFTVFWLTTTAVISLAALFIVGLGISGQYPLALARMIQSSDGLTDRATALASVGMGLALASAPAALGVLGDRMGISTGILLVPVLGILSVSLIVLVPVRGNCASRWE
ncbi:MFS transporter [Specibacter sp. RAF43]|uniref:MFS transporter n=1 Tax=Specibacter sp. RAF43 TaxID=3233057 RepID=UPI003F957503